MRLTLIGDLLATTPGDKEIYANFIANKAYEGVEDAKQKEQIKKNIEAELDNIDEEIAGTLEKGTTFFFKDKKGNPYIYSYLIKGFLKAACGSLRKVNGTLSSKIKAYKKEIDTLFFVFPDEKKPQGREIPLELSGPLTMYERPLRAQTMQGERIGLARSERAPAGTTLEFDICMLRESDEALLKELLDYGKFSGLGQFRSAGFGAFTWEEVKPKKTTKKKAS